MKQLLIFILMLLSFSLNSTAQNVTREGNIFSTTTRVKADTIVTSFLFKDSHNISYPIIINKSTGRCYVWKKSERSGKFYRYYMKQEIAREVCRELGITYAEG